jgi:PhzF family phenazine biosynthesis protein
MDTREVVLADAFASAPTGGVPVAVVPDGTDLADDRLGAVARELDAVATAVAADDPEPVRAVGPRGPVDHHPQATVGALAVGAERGWIEPETSAEAGGSAVPAVDGDGRAWTALDEPTPRTAGVDLGTTAAALGVDRAALDDVGADLPPFLVSVGVEALAVPVNFLEHLGSATPDPGRLADLADATSVEAVCAFTFDTLTSEAVCHARTFVPRTGRGEGSPWVRTAGSEVPVAPAVVGGVAVHLSREGVVEADGPTVEAGHYLDRPARVSIDIGPDLRLGGRAVAALDGTVVVPPSEDGDIVEV